MVSDITETVLANATNSLLTTTNKGHALALILPKFSMAPDITVNSLLEILTVMSRYFSLSSEAFLSSLLSGSDDSPVYTTVLKLLDSHMPLPVGHCLCTSRRDCHQHDLVNNPNTFLSLLLTSILDNKVITNPSQKYDSHHKSATSIHSLISRHLYPHYD